MSVSSEDSDKPGPWSGSDPWKKLKHAPGAYPVSPNMESSRNVYGLHTVNTAVRARRNEYTRKKQVKIKVGTWNTASISGTAKDLGGWFVQGLGVKGLHQDLSGLSLGAGTNSHDRNIESVEEQEARAKKKSCTLPRHESPAIASDGDIGLYVLGLQEVVDVSSVTEVMRPYYDHNPAKKWKHAIKDSLPSGYEKVAEMQLLGLLILVYAAPDVVPQISSVDTQSVGTGALGYAGNKGAVSVRIVLGGTTRVLFVNCHLAAGADDAALTRRIWDTNQILSRTKFQPVDVDGTSLGPLEHESIGDEDFAFWFGDLNYRLDDIPGEDVRRLLLLHTRNEYDTENKSSRKIDSELGYIDAQEDEQRSLPDRDDPDEGGRAAKYSSAEPPLDPNDDPASLITTIKSLLVHDQLKAQQKLRKAFHEGWREGEIGFLPTYKYDVGSVGMFDSGEKKRSPSWCDRILFRTRRDRLEYEDRVAHEAETRKRDEDMKARGIEDVVAEHEVLFNYDPDTDGNGDYDEYDENDDEPRKPQRVMTDEGFEDIIKLEDYVSHQRVLSSDHKPLSAVFTLTYDAVIPELRSRIHQEVTKEFDKTENEGRPSVTVVVENPPGAATTADHSTGATELNAVIFDDVRYRIPQIRNITIANTSPILATFAFINRPSDDSEVRRPAPSWLRIHIDQDGQTPLQEADELEGSIRFTLEPGEVTNVSITIEIIDYELVWNLNNGSKSLDDVLVLRVLNGRDHFIRITAAWLPTSFCRSIEELVRFPSGVRHAIVDTNHTESRTNVPSHHSAPSELFALTEAIPGLVERAAADWAMLKEGEDAPWTKDSLWPFSDSLDDNEEAERRQHDLAAVREALDTGTPFGQHLDLTLSSLKRAELLAETLSDFLKSLKDGIITAALWSAIESNITIAEKAKSVSDTTDVQEIVMNTLSTSPVHSVSFTFITFMLTRIISELSNAETSVSNTSQSQPSQSRSRSSTQTSNAPSYVSIVSSPISPTSPKSRLSFFPSISLSRSRTNNSLTTNTNTNSNTNTNTNTNTDPSTTSAIMSNTTTAKAPPQRFPPLSQSQLPNSSSTPSSILTPQQKRIHHTESYISKFADIIIRTEQEHDQGQDQPKNKTKLKTKEKKILDARKRKVLGSFLGNGFID